MAKKLRATVLYEDAEHYKFAKRLLESRFDLHRGTRWEPCDGHTGVVRRFAELLPDYVSSRNAQKSYAVVVVIDGDPKGAAVRQQLLWNAVERKTLDRVYDPKGQRLKSANERIAVISPVLSIETWLRHLTHHGDDSATDELTDYEYLLSPRPKDWEASAWSAAVNAFNEACRASFARAPLPSMDAACAELARLEAALPL